MAPVAIDSTPSPDVFRVPDATITSAKPTVCLKYEHPTRKLEDVRIQSNSGPMNPENMGWLQPVYAGSTTMDDMRGRFMNQGYLWVKCLIPRSDILEFRRKYFEFMAPTGVLKEGTDPIEGTYCGANPDVFLPPGSGKVCYGDQTQAEKFVQRSIEAHRTDFLEEISSHPAMVNFVKEFTSWPAAKLLKRQMLRANVPGAETLTHVDQTAVHYDHIFLRYGPPTFLTGWLPFGDIAVEGGGLTYLENSVPLAQSIEDEFNRRAEKFTPEERINAFNANMMRGGVLSQDSQEFASAHGNGKWLIADYEAGDIVFHHPFAIHASCVNESPTQTIRLATNLRFVNPEAPYDTRWTNYWYPNDGL